MKNLLSSLVNHSRKLTRNQRFLQFLRIVLQEKFFLSFIILCFLLSLEAILPGTTSVRLGIVFFVWSIGLLIMLERGLASHIDDQFPPEKHDEDIPRKNKFVNRLSLIIFILWAILLFANASLGFAVPILLLILFLVTIIFCGFLLLIVSISLKSLFRGEN